MRLGVPALLLRRNAIQRMIKRRVEAAGIVTLVTEPLAWIRKSGVFRAGHSEQVTFGIAAHAIAFPHAGDV
jgi:hypothetical protein